jgi:hypothetical protein
VLQPKGWERKPTAKMQEPLSTENQASKKKILNNKLVNWKMGFDLHKTSRKHDYA